MKSVRDAKLLVMDRIKVFFEFFTDGEPDEMTAAEWEEIQEDALFKAELLIGALGIDIVSVEGGVATATINMPDFDEFLAAKAAEMGDE